MLVSLTNCPYPECNRQEPLDDVAVVCPTCRQPLLRCPLCGVANRLWANYCRSCGGGRQRDRLPVGGWKMLKGNPHLTSTAAYQCPYPADEWHVQRKWQRDLRTDIVAPIIAAYLHLICVTRAGQVLRIQEADGDPHEMGFSLPSNDDPVYTPAVDGQTLFLASGHALMAYDLRSSSLRWHYDVDNPKLFASDVIACGGRITIALYDRSRGMTQILCFTPAERNPCWTCTLPNTGSPPTVPVLTDRGLIVGLTDGEIYLIDLQIGEIIARTDSRHRIKSGISNTVAPAHQSGLTYFVDPNGKLYSVRSFNDRLETADVWDFKTGFVNGLAVSEQYICSAEASGISFFKHREKNGWTTRDVTTVDQVKSPPILCGDVAFAASRNGQAIFCDLNSPSARLHQVPLGFGSAQEVFTLCSGETFFVASSSGQVAALVVQNSS